MVQSARVRHQMVRKLDHDGGFDGFPDLRRGGSRAEGGGRRAAGFWCGEVEVGAGGKKFPLARPLRRLGIVVLGMRCQVCKSPGVDGGGDICAVCGWEQDVLDLVSPAPGSTTTRATRGCPVLWSSANGCPLHVARESWALECEVARRLGLESPSRRRWSETWQQELVAEDWLRQNPSE